MKPLRIFYTLGMSPEWIGQARQFFRQSSPKPRSVLVVGDLALDRFVFGSVERISPEAPVPVLAKERMEHVLGCAGNVARNLAALAADVPALSLAVMGVVGQDPAGEELGGLLRELGTKAHIETLSEKGRPTTVKTRYLAGAQHQLLRVDEESLEPLQSASRDELLKRFETNLRASPVVVLQDYAKGLFGEGLLPKLIARSREHKAFVIVDPNRNTPADFYRGASLITPNVAEAESLLGRSLHRGRDDREMAQACLDLRQRLGLEMAMITRSGHGITLADPQDQVFHFPALARAVFDVTGAGDTTVAVLAAALGMGASLPVACTLATAAASVVVAKVGTSTARLSEIEDELDAIRQA